MTTPTRRPLTAGIAQALPGVDPDTAARFITGEAPTLAPPEMKPAVDRTPRSPLTTRLRKDVADALKRASLERQLSGETPSAVQDILEEALTPWLQRHGYLP
jgi:hypothetical protein